MSPEKPRIAGELRLRVTSGNDSAFFESGSDLLLPDGHPWSRPLYSVSKLYPLLYEKLREDRLIPDDLDTGLAALPSRRYRRLQSRVLYTLNDTYIVDFSMYVTVFFVITEQGMDWLPFRRLFFDCRLNAIPYTGTHIGLPPSILLYLIFSQEVPWLDMNVQRSQSTKAQGPLCYAFSR
jgi:hypothetical protein